MDFDLSPEVSETVANYFTSALELRFNQIKKDRIIRLTVPVEAVQNPDQPQNLMEVDTKDVNALEADIKLPCCSFRPIIQRQFPVWNVETYVISQVISIGLEPPEPVTSTSSSSSSASGISPPAPKKNPVFRVDPYQLYTCLDSTLDAALFWIIKKIQDHNDKVNDFWAGAGCNFPGFTVTNNELKLHVELPIYVSLKNAHIFLSPASSVSTHGENLVFAAPQKKDILLKPSASAPATN